MQSINLQPNIIYENNPREVLSVLGREYDRIYEEIILLQPGSREYKELKKQGQENIQAREKLLTKLLTQEVQR